MSRDRFRTSRSAFVRAGPGDVMTLLRDASTWPQWQPEIRTASGPSSLGTGDAVEGKAAMLGFGVEGRSTVTDVGNGSFDEDVVIGVRLRIRFELAERDGGVVVTHTLDSDLPTGPAGRVVGFFLRYRLRKMQRDVLARLARQVEESTP